MNEQEQEKSPEVSKPYESMKQLSAAKGIPEFVLKLAKRKNAPGFTGSRIHWDQFEPWYNEHKEELEQQAQESKEFYETQYKKWSSEKARLEVQQLKGNQLDKESTRTFLRSLISAANAILADIPNDYSPKFTGLTMEQAHVQLQNLVTAICYKMSSDEVDKHIDKPNVK